MKRVLVMMIGATGALACSSETTGATPAGCSEVTGNYDVKVTRIGGSCPPGDGDGKVTVTISRVEGALNVAFPGVEGGCPAELNAASCKLTALCKLFDLKTKDTLATFNVDYTFAGSTFSGTLAATLNPPVSARTCDSNVRHEGTKL